MLCSSSLLHEYTAIGFFPFRTIINKALVKNFICVIWCACTHIYPGVALLYHRIGVCLACRDTTKWFSIGSGSTNLPICQHLVLSVFLILDIVVACRNLNPRVHTDFISGPLLLWASQRSDLNFSSLGWSLMSVPRTHNTQSSRLQQSQWLWWWRRVSWRERHQP